MKDDDVYDATSHDAVSDGQGSSNDDQLMKRISTPPEFPPAKRDQVEQTWRAIVREIEVRETEHAAALRSPRPRARRTLPAWFEALFPAAPGWSWHAVQVAALVVIGFGAAWIAAGRGWLPVTAPAEVVSMPKGDNDGPDRAWLAVSDYGTRLESLLLGVSKGDTAAMGDVAPAAREVSRELLNDNRFYQRVAERRGDPALSELLSRMEVILLALATAPEGQEQEVIRALREFIDESDVLGDLREVRSSVPQRSRPSVVTAGS